MSTTSAASDGRVGSERAHRDADIGPREDRGVVDAVPDEGKGAAPMLFPEKLLDMVYLVGRQESGVHLVDAEGFRHAFTDRRLVAGEHHGFSHALGFQGGDGVSGVWLDPHPR